MQQEKQHLSSQFDADLNLLSSKLLEMGGLVESQIVNAMDALNNYNETAIRHVATAERRVNEMEIEIDQQCNDIIARRQPAARDLRLLMAVSKAITNLERAGDEAQKVAKRTQRIIDDGAGRAINTAEIRLSGEMAASILHNVLDAFARLDINAALQIIRDDRSIDSEFDAFVRKLATYMMEDPRTISVGLDYLFVAKAIERIGDHAKNIAELIIYIVKGTDVRHMPRETMEREALS
ncbi:phosphate signaling complex protein PhoU [Robbsia sp. KACC 23696]|uniref:phosphate signaling complex protein PhoU n=1 Tax=Robbsia sp. KACC 23696 TaxID=3149231 RepID=UPI00325BFD36